MKKLAAFLCIVLLFAASLPVKAARSYINLHESGLSSYRFGEDIIIHGDTDFPHVVLGLYYPKDSGYGGRSKSVYVVTAKELKDGFVIPAGEGSSWPEGIWCVRAQNGNVQDELYFSLVSEPVFDRTLIAAEYNSENALISLFSYPSRGLQRQQNKVFIPLSDSRVLKIFYWSNSLSPASYGRGTAYFALFDGEYLVEAKRYTASLPLTYPLSFTSGDGTTLKLFIWEENSMTPARLY